MDVICYEGNVYQAPTLMECYEYLKNILEMYGRKKEKEIFESLPTVKKNATLLSWFIISKNFEFLRYYVIMGDPNLMTTILNTPCSSYLISGDESGHTPTMYAYLSMVCAGHEYPSVEGNIFGICYMAGGQFTPTTTTKPSPWSKFLTYGLQYFPL